MGVRLPAVCFVLLLPVGAAAQTGGEFVVNAYTTGDQLYGAVAVEPDGDFVIVWNSIGQDGDQNGVFGRRFDASGAPRGAEFQVNTDTAGSQGDPSIAVGAGGDFIVAWASQDGGYFTVHGRRYDTGGNPLGPSFPLSPFATAFGQGRVKVGMAADGSFVVAWHSHYGVQARLFDAVGNPRGPQFLVPVSGDAFQVPSLAVAPPGSFVVVWNTVFDPQDGSAAIRGQRFDAAGVRLGGEFRLNSFTTGNQSTPSVSHAPGGGFAAAWYSGEGDGSGAAIMGRRFDAQGAPLGADFVVNTYTTGHQWRPSATHDGAGNFVVTWAGPALRSGDDIFAQRFDPAGARLGGEFRVNTYTTGDQKVPVIASHSAAGFVVTWTSGGRDGDGWALLARRSQDIGMEAAALAVDPVAIPSSNGNRVHEPGETVVVQPAWRNRSLAAVNTAATLGQPGGPAGASYVVTDGLGAYTSVAPGATASCADCYALFVSDPPARPALHWDAQVTELLAAAPLEEKRWTIHLGGSFADVPPANPFYAFVETLLHHGISGGCAADRFCPASPVTREQMAAFVLVAREGAGYAPPACGATPMFADVPASSPFCRWIEELARRGVVAGCDASHYCPSAPTTREEMAVFVLRTLDPALLPPFCVAPNLFADVPETSAFCRWVEELANRGIVTGCGGGNYCPSAAVSREQMGVFIGVTFGLTLYGV